MSEPSSSSSSSIAPVSWKAAIVDCLEVTDAIRYIIEVTRGTQQWIIRKRYTDFSELHKKLKDKFQPYMLPFLPPKCYRLFGPDAEFLDARKSALQRYLDLLSASRELASSPAVEAFLARHRDGGDGDGGGTALPSQLPDVPAGSHEPGALAAADRALGSVRAALRTLFLLQQALEVDPFLSNRLAIIDSRRRQMATSGKTLRRSLPEVDALQRELQPRDAPLAAHLGECARLARVALKWIENIESEEGPLIRHFLKEAKEIRSVSWYEAQVTALLASARAEEWGITLPEPAAKLVENIKQEREYRRQVGQLVAVQMLRDLQHQLSDLKPAAGSAKHPPSAASSQRQLPEVSHAAAAAAASSHHTLSPATIVEALQRTTRVVVANVDAVLGSLSVGADTAEVGGKLSRLGGDVEELQRIVDEMRQMLASNPEERFVLPTGTSAAPVSSDEEAEEDEDGLDGDEDDD